MRTLLTILISNFAYVVLVVGQTGATCPKISVTSEEEALVAGDSAQFTAIVEAVGRAAEYEFRWSVSTGTIVEGQGTPKIVVSTTEEDGGRSLSATVIFKRIADGCTNSASATVSVTVIEINDRDYYGRLDVSGIRSLIDNAFTLVNNNPSHELFIVLEFDKTDSQISKLSRVRAIIDAIKRRRFDASRATLAIAKRPTEHEYRIDLAPQGSRYPVDQAEFYFVECEKLLNNINAAFPDQE